jgi:hypothetical protein
VGRALARILAAWQGRGPQGPVCVPQLLAGFRCVMPAHFTRTSNTHSTKLFRGCETAYLPGWKPARTHIHTDVLHSPQAGIGRPFMHLRRAWHSIGSPYSRPNRARALRPRAALPVGNMAAECASAAGPAVAAVAQASYSLFLTALKEGAGGPGGCFLSPLSIVYALSLAINGAGRCDTCTLQVLREAQEASGARHWPVARFVQAADVCAPASAPAPEQAFGP